MIGDAFNGEWLVTVLAGRVLDDLPVPPEARHDEDVRAEIRTLTEDAVDGALVGYDEETMPTSGTRLVQSVAESYGLAERDGRLVHAAAAAASVDEFARVLTRRVLVETTAREVRRVVGVEPETSPELTAYGREDRHVDPGDHDEVPLPLPVDDICLELARECLDDLPADEAIGEDVVVERVRATVEPHARRHVYIADGTLSMHAALVDGCLSELGVSADEVLGAVDKSATVADAYQELAVAALREGSARAGVEVLDRGDVAMEK